MRILLLATMMIFASSVSAGLYKWVDSEGNVHYSQKRPRDKQYKRIKAPAPATEASQPLYKSTKLNNKTSITVDNEVAKNEKIRATNCANAKQNLSGYQLSRRIRDKEGNVKIVDDKERARQIDMAKKAINQFCN